MEFTIYFSDIIGYVASAVVLISFLMKNMNTLRMVNAAGALLFIVYGCLINFSIPIIITNFAIACINVFYLVKAKNKKS